MSFEFGMQRPTGLITEAAEPDEYDVDEEELDATPAAADKTCVVT